MTDTMPSIIPDWLATLFALYCLTGAVFLTVCLVWGASELVAVCLRWSVRHAMEHRSR